MKLIDNASGNVSQGITLSSENKSDKYKLSYNCSNIGNGKSYIRIYATLSDTTYKTYFMPIQFSGDVSFEISIDGNATFLQFAVIGNATLTNINLENVLDATMEYVKANASYWDRIKEITSNTGKVRTDMLEGLINLTLNAFANESGTITQENGVLTFLNGTTPEDSTEAVQIVGGAIRVADSKLPNGDWNWSVAITGRGINAATIIAETFAALNITGVTITSGTITGGTINGVTINGSTIEGGKIYSGNRKTGNYTSISEQGEINIYLDNVMVASLFKFTEFGGYFALYNTSGQPVFRVQPSGSGQRCSITTYGGVDWLSVGGDFVINGDLGVTGQINGKDF